jgi:putative membrane protein
VSAASSAADAPEWRRLSTRMLVVHPVVELVRALPWLIGVVLAGSRTGNGDTWGLAGVAITIGYATLRWVTTRYRITAERVQIRRGVLRRQLVSVSRDRVRTVDVTSPALHRLLGLARVTVGTGRSDRRGEGDLRLDGLAAGQAAALRDELLHRAPPPAEAAAPGAPPAGAPPEAVLARLEPRWIAYGPFTLSGIVAIGVAAGIASRLINEGDVDPKTFGPLRATIDHLSRIALPLAIAEVALAVVVFVAAASTAGYLLAFWNFSLTRNPRGTLHVTRGLLTTRATTIEERRLRGVEVSEPLLLRAVGGARCIAIATGLRVGRGAERGGSLLLPPAPREQVQRVAAAVLGADEPVSCPLAAHGPRARRRRFTRTLSVAAIVVAVLAGLTAALGWPVTVALAALPAIPVAALLAADRYRSLGHALVGGRLVTRTGSLVRRRSVLSCEGIIGFNVERSLFQRRAGLATLVATTAAGHQRYAVADVAAADAIALADAAVPGLLTPFLADR